MVSKDVFQFQKALNIPDDEAFIIEPLDRLIRALHGKRCLILETWRYFNHWFKLPEEKLRKCEAIMECFYFYGIIGDDMIDSTELRRGISTTHLVYGVPKTIHLVSYLQLVLIKNISYLATAESSHKFQDFLDNIFKVGVCQTLETDWREQSVCPTEEEFFMMIHGKSTNFFLFGINLMQSLSNDKTTDYSKLTGLYGIFIALYNDFVNLCSAGYAKEKGFCEDITEGKFSFPVVHAVHMHPSDNRIINILKQKPTDIEVKKSCLNLLKDFGSLDYTKKYLERVTEEAIAEIRRLGGNPEFEQVLERAMLDYETTSFLD